jgi:hypothetical protein
MGYIVGKYSEMISGTNNDSKIKFDQPEPRILYGGHVCLQIERKWEIFFRVSSIDASYHVSVHLSKQFQRCFFRKRPTYAK